MSRSYFCWAILPVLLFSCSESQNITPKQTQPSESLQAQSAQIYQVVDSEGSPIIGAEVLIRGASRSPVQRWTDDNGQFEVPQSRDLKTDVTVLGHLYTPRTFYGIDPRHRVLTVQTLLSDQLHEVTGDLVDYPEMVDKDNTLHIGVAFLAPTKLDLLNLDVSKFISPVSVEADLNLGSLRVPTNVNIPRQKEKYGIFTIKIKKDAYQIYSSRRGTQRFVGFQVQAPFKQMVRAAQRKEDPLDIVNLLKAASFGWTDIDVQEAQTTQNISLGQDQADQPYTLSVPSFDEGLMFVSLSALQSEQYLIPMDFRIGKSAEAIQLHHNNSDNQWNISVLRPNDIADSGITEQTSQASQQASIAMTPITEQVTPLFLPLIKPPTPTESGDLAITLPELPNGLQQAGMSLTLVQVDTLPDNPKIEITTPLWQGRFNEWSDQFSLPNEIPTMDDEKTYRWELLIFASPIDTGPVSTFNDNLDLVTHFTRNAYELK